MRSFFLPAAIFLAGWIVTILIAEVIAEWTEYPSLYALVFAVLIPTVLAVSMNFSDQPVSVGWTVDLTVIVCLLAGGFPLLHDPVLAAIYYIGAVLVFIVASWVVARFLPGAIGDNPD